MDVDWLTFDSAALSIPDVHHERSEKRSAPQMGRTVSRERARDAVSFRLVVAVTY